MREVTGVGSLPHADLESALAFVFRWAPRWPWLPELGAGMVPAGLGQGPDSALPELPRAFVERVQRSEAVGVKLQLAGPVTLSACAPERELAELTERVLRTARGWMAQVGGPGMLVLDEPMLSASVSSSAEQGLRELVGALKSEGWAVGLHCCAPPPFPLLNTLGLDLLSVDTVRYGAALEAGGFEGQVLWGAVAVEDCAVGAVGPGWVTPSCGLALQTVAQAERVMGVVARLAGQ